MFCLQGSSGVYFSQTPNGSSLNLHHQTAYGLYNSRVSSGTMDFALWLLDVVDASGLLAHY